MTGPALRTSDNAIQDLLELMKRLRDPRSGCPWDLEQDFKSIAPYTIEEAYEVADAIERDDMSDLKEELGDLFLQVVFHSQMAEDAGEFNIEDVARGVVNKMVVRHPHVFGDADIKTADEQTKAWEDVKEAQRLAKSQTEAASVVSALDGVARTLPALTRADKLLKRAARTGFEWPTHADIVAKLHEELAEVEEAAKKSDHDALEDELGDVLIVVANLAKKYDVDPEQALRRASQKFEGRFRSMEALASSSGQSFAELNIDDQVKLWQQVKTEENQ